MKMNRIAFWLLLAFGNPPFASAADSPGMAAEQKVSFTDAMGRNVPAILQMPAASSGPPAGGVLMLSPSPTPAAGRMDRSEDDGGAARLAAALQSAGLAVLRVQLTVSLPAQGHVGSSQEGSLEQTVKSAIDFLSGQCGENGDRIAVSAEREAADVAILGAYTKRQVCSFLLLAGRLSQRAREVLAEQTDMPVLCLVSSEDKTALRDMTDIYFAPKHAVVDIQVFEGLGTGSQMIKRWSEEFPQREPLERTVANWLRRQLSSVGRAQEVSFVTEDGWQLFGNLLLPARDGNDAPGVILLHSGRSDRSVFVHLERMLVKAGFAVLNIDWRGRGKSINKGKYMVKTKTFDYTLEERAKGTLDAKAAIDFLTAQSGVDKNRIGFVGIAHGAEHAVGGSIGDSRVKAFVLLTGYWPPDEKERARQRAYLTSGQVDVMYITCTGHGQVTEAMRALYEMSPSKLSRFLLYDGGPLGYQLFEIDNQLEPTIVEWFKEGLMR